MRLKQTSSNISEEALVQIKDIAKKEKWSVATTVGVLVDQALKERNRKKKYVVL